MDVRDEYARMLRLRAVARQLVVAPDRVGELIQPFIDKYKNLRLAHKKCAGGAAVHPRHDVLVKAIAEAGARLHGAGLRGLKFHNTFQRALVELAPGFGYRGFTECLVRYDVETDEVEGRMDVVWADKRVPRVLFEIDRTVKRASWRKLALAEGAHKYWIYFGEDVWEFKTALKKWDPAREVWPVVVPNTFVPKWKDAGV